MNNVFGTYGKASAGMLPEDPAALLRRTEGATAIEYAIIASIMVAAMIVSVPVIGAAVADMIASVLPGFGGS